MEIYAIISVDGSVIEEVGPLRKLFPTVKFPASGPSAEWLSERYTFRVSGAVDYDPKTERLVSVEPFIAGPGDVRSVQVVALTAEEIAAAFDAKKQDRIATLSAEFSSRRNAGVTVSGNVYATTNDGHQELKALKERLDRVGGTQKAVTRAGDFIEADATQATAIFTAVDDYIAACWTREYVLRVEIIAATDAAELEAIDITSGWPVSEQPQ